MLKILKLYPLLFFIFCHTTSAQVPNVIWQRCLGGVLFEYGYSIELTSDGGYIIGSFTQSDDGDVTGNHGNSDLWIVKLNSVGDLLWQRCYGGSGSEGEGRPSIKQMPNGDFVFACSSYSSDGDASNNHGLDDYWVVRIDSIGNIIWEKSFGGSEWDHPASIVATSDNGCAVLGQTNSLDGDVTDNHGLGDYWLIKLDSVGNLEWQKSYGGSYYEQGYNVIQIDDGYLLSGVTSSTDGDITGNHGLSDFWIVKVDHDGNLLWQKALGGSESDGWSGAYATQSSDGGYAVAGISWSNNGNANPGCAGNNWIIKLTQNGAIEWDYCYGGSGVQFLSDIRNTPDGGYLVAGTSNSNDGDITGNHGDYDYCLMKLGSSGNLQWQKSLGGSNVDDGYSAISAENDNIVVVGYAGSDDGDVSGNHGVFDCWVIKLKNVGNYITGNCFIDYNQNSFHDLDEPPIHNLTINTSKADLVFQLQPNPEGEFSNFVDTGTFITTVHDCSYYTWTPSEFSSSFTGYQNYDTINFAFVPVSIIRDILITIIPLNEAGPGFNTDYRIIYTNIGTDTVSGYAEMIKDPDLTFLSATPEYTFMSNDSISWDFINLLPDETREIDVSFSVAIPPMVEVGDYLNSSVLIEPIASDEDAGNNVSILSQLVTGSYDPNDKSMLGGESITPAQIADGSYLTYLIRFQNTGTDTAINITVRDSLDAQLDWSSLAMVSSSHSYNLSIESDGFLKWNFNNIFLPDSNVDEPGSHGYICYKIKPDNSLLPGSIIKNSASIYFDFNLPVQTNTVETIVEIPTSVHELDGIPLFELYPNPTTGMISVQFKPQMISPAIVEIYDIAGRKLKALQTDVVNKGINQITFDISFLPVGIYTFKLMSEGTCTMKKVVKTE